jgi:hypothetical protein
MTIRQLVREWNNYPFIYTFSYLNLTFLCITANYDEWKAKIPQLLAVFSLNFTLHSTEMSDHVVRTCAMLCISSQEVFSVNSSISHTCFTLTMNGDPSLNQLFQKYIFGDAASRYRTSQVLSYISHQYYNTCCCWGGAFVPAPWPSLIYCASPSL